MVCNFVFGEHYDQQEFQMVCMMYASGHNIYPIKELEHCLLLPERGVFVRRYNRITRYYPSVHGPLFDEEVAKMLGTYSVDGDRIAFINTDGKTYVTFGLEFLSVLQKAGFKEKEFIVPFGPDEKIEDADFAEQWSRIAC